MNQLKCDNLIFILLIAATICWMGFRRGKAAKQAERAYYTIRYNTDIFQNRDSLLYYAALAYKDEDPDALGITGTAAFIYDGDEAAHDTLPIVSTDEGAIMLLRAAELGNARSAWIITCLNYHGAWHHSLPENK